LKISSDGIGLKLPGFIILALIIINLYLTTIPLTNTLGYELSVINGILLFLSSGFIAIKLSKKEDDKNFIDLISENKKIFLIINTLPFIISLISSIIISKCPIKDGFLFYLTITIPASFFGLVTGFFSVALSKKYSIPFFLLLFFLMLFSAAIEFFIHPQIYFYNSIFGFYPGTIYDEDLSVDRILIAYRIFNLAFFIGLVSLSEYLSGKNRVSKFLASLLLIIIIVTFSYLKPALQFATDINRLESNLCNSILTESFQIHFSPSMSQREVEYAAILHEYYLDQIMINLTMNTKHKIDSYIFKDRNQKRVLLGAGNADIAKPWLNQIYLNSSNYEVTLKHELVHVLGGEFGSTIFRIAENFNPSMIEGLAMSVENNYDGYPVHYMAKLAYQAGYKFPIDELFSGLNFFTKTSSISYIYSGSFIKYLSDKYGVEKIKKLYGDSDFTKIFGKNISTLALEYDVFLKNYQIDFNKYKAQLYFGGTTIFKKFCPRAAAADVKKGWELFNKQNTNEALELFQKVFQYSNSYQSLSGIISCYSKEKKYVEAKKFLSRQLPNFRSSPYYFYLELAYGDLLIRCNEQFKAVNIYDSLLFQNPHIQYTNEVVIRNTILNEGLDSLKNYFAKNETLKYQKLLKMNTGGIKYFSIPALLLNAERINLEMKELFNVLKKKIKVTDPISGYAALEISRLALQKSDYETAQYFAVLAMNFKQDDNLSHLYIENLRMVNWFKNNAEELKLTFQYKK
jgi:hypothetical protein